MSGETLGPQNLRDKFLQTVQDFFSGKIKLKPRPDFVDEDPDGFFQPAPTPQEVAEMMESLQNQVQDEK